jgi:hypothetical protein
MRGKLPVTLPGIAKRDDGIDKDARASEYDDSHLIVSGSILSGSLFKVAEDQRGQG